MMNILACFGFGNSSKTVAIDLTPLQKERSLQAIQESINTLSGAILQNNEIYNQLKEKYKTMSEAPGFSRNIYSAQCNLLLKEIGDLEVRRNMQQQEKEKLRNELDHYCATYFFLDANANAEARDIEQVKQIEAQFLIQDGLNEKDRELRYMKNYTWDSGAPLGDEPECYGRIRSFLCWCPIAIVCNPLCCGLRGRVQQLKQTVENREPLCASR